MPDRKAKERFDDWQEAGRAEAASEEGSATRRRAHATTRRARWKFEDATRADAEDRGAAPESLDESMGRALRRMREAADDSATIPGQRSLRRADDPDTNEQRDKRVADEAEITRELGDD